MTRVLKLDDYEDAPFQHGYGCLVAEDFEFGSNLKLGHYVIIEPGCKVGDDVQIGNYVLLKRGTVIGSRVFVDSYVKSSGENQIGSDVTLRFNATIARGVTVEDGVFISPNVMTIYSTHQGEKRSGTVIGANSHIGTDAVLGPAVQIAPGTVVGALTYVNKDIPEPGIYVGSPARCIKEGVHVPTPEAKADYLKDYKK